MADLRNTSILFLGKKDDQYCKRAIDFLKLNFSNLDICLGQWGDPLPKKVLAWEGDYIISYLCRWVLSKEIINSASTAAINFHPASTKYPGIGCYNFALYKEDNEYGVTCHYMSETVDTGKIISTKEFPILPTDNVESLLKRTYDFQLILFYEILMKIINGSDLPISDKKWERKPYTRQDFEDLLIIKPDMDEHEIKRRERATKYEGWEGNGK